MEHFDSQKKYISLREASERIPYSQDYLRLLIRLGYLQGVKLGRNWFTRQDWIDEYLKKYSRKVERDEKSEPAFDEAPIKTYSRYSIFAVISAGKAAARSFYVPISRQFKNFIRIFVDYKYLLARLALLFFTVSVTTAALASPNFLSSLRLLSDSIVYPIANTTKSLTYISNAGADKTIGDFLLRVSPPTPRQAAIFVAHMPARALAWAKANPPTPEKLTRAIYDLAEARLGGLTQETIGDFLISVKAPSPPRALITGFREDLTRIFTDVHTPSAEPVLTALRDIFENSFAFRFPAFKISLPSFSKIFGLKQPAPPEIKPVAQIPVVPEATTTLPAPSGAPEQQITQVHEVIEKKEVISTADVSVFQKKLDELNGYINSQVAKLMRDIFELTTKVDAKTAFTVFAQSQKIDQLISPTIVSGLTISSGDLTSSGGFSFTGAGSIGGALTVSKNISSGGLLTVSGSGTSTFSSNVSVGGNFQVGGTCLNCGGVQSFAGWTQSGSNVFLTTSTNSVGIGTSTPGAKLAVNGSSIIQDTLTIGGILKATSTALLATDAGSVGIGTTSPGSLLAVNGPILAQTGTSTLGGIISPTLFSTTTLGFYTSSNSSPRLTIDTVGNLGLATTSPDSMFSILQNANGRTFISAYRITDTAPSGDFINYHTNSGTTLFRVDNSGNLLAGGIINSGSQTITSTSQPQFRVQFNPTNEWTVSVSSVGATTFAVNGTSPSLTFTPQTNSANTFNFTNAASASILSIDTQNGRVGIGTTSPGLLLSLKGPFLANGTSTIEGGSLIAQGLYSTTSLAFYTSSNGTPRVKIDESGNVGIGTTSPGTLLSVAGGLLVQTDAQLFGPITERSAATSTFTGGISSAGLSSSAGLVISTGDLIASGGKLTISGSGTSTISGGLSLGTTGGLASSAGLTVTGGSILATGIGATFGSTTAVSPSFSNGAVISSGDFLVNTGKIVSGGVGTSTFTGGLAAAGLQSTANGLRVSAGDTVLAGGLQVAGGSNFTGNVGIGTTSPGAKLGITSDTEGPLILFGRSDNTSPAAIGASAFNKDLIFYAGVPERVRIKGDTGNVGIGTAAPATPLAVVGGVRLGDSATIAGTSNALTVRRAGADSAIYFTLIDELAVTQTIASGGAGRRQDLVFSNDASGNYIFSTGNLGIGTTSPFANLSVNQATGQFGFAVGSTSATSFIVNERGDVGVGINPANLGSNVVNRGDLANPRLGVYFNSGAATDTAKALIAADIDVTGQARNRVFVVYANGDVKQDGSLTVIGAINTTGGADYAEWLETDDTDLEAGELVSVDGHTVNHIKRANKAADSYLIGIISTKPGFISGFHNGEGDPHWKKVSFLGQVPAKVTGDIAIGDRITSSDIPGVGQKVNAGEPTVCIALEPHSGSGVDKINCLISRNNFGYSKLDNTAMSLAAASSTSSGGPAGQSVPWTVDPYLGKVNVAFAGDINLKGNALLDVGRISGMWGKWSVDENGMIIAEGITTEDLAVKRSAVFGTASASLGITIYDRATHEPVCVFSEHGALRSEPGACGSVTAPPSVQSKQPVSGNTTTTATSMMPNTTATTTTAIITGAPTTSTTTPTVIGTTTATTTTP